MIKSINNHRKPQNTPPKNQPGQKVFTSEEKIQICRWLAWFKTPKEIQDLVLEDFGKTIDHSTIIKSYKNNPQWKELISKLRKQYINMISESPLANKKVRLDRLERLYHEAMIHKTKAIIKGREIKGCDLSLALQVIREAREEAGIDDSSCPGDGLDEIIANDDVNDILLDSENG